MDSPTAFFHAKALDGGLVIPRLRYLIPILKLSRLDKIQSSDDVAMKWVRSTVSHKNRVTRARSFAVIKDQVVTTRAVYQVVLRDQLLSTCDGKGLCNHNETPHVNSWVTDGTLLLTGGDYVQAIKVRGNLLPTGERSTRGRRSVPPKCDAGCNAVESLGHISQSCSRTHLIRCARHNSVAKYIDKRCCELNYEVWSEPSIVTSMGLRKPDLIVYNQNVCYIIDVSITADFFPMTRPYNAKLLYYNINEIRSWLEDKLPGRSLIFEAVIINWRGAFHHRSSRALRNLGLTKMDLKIMTVRVLTFTANLYKSFVRSTTRRSKKHRSYEYGKPVR